MVKTRDINAIEFSKFYKTNYKNQKKKFLSRQSIRKLITVTLIYFYIRKIIKIFLNIYILLMIF